MNQQTRRWAIAALVVVVLLVLVASFGAGSKPNPRAEKAGSSTTNTLVGGLLVIVGGALTLVGNYWMETRRWKREDEHRDHAERRRSYYEYLAAWETCEEVRTRLNQPFIPDHISGIPELRQAQMKLLSRFNALSLLAPLAVRKEALGMRKGQPGAGGRFWKAARQDLGIPPDPPDPPAEERG